MRYDPADRILSISFKRDSQEHADVMIEAGKRLIASDDPVSAWKPFVLVVGIGAATGIAMELYRRFILPQLLDTTDIAPLSVIAAQLLPLLLLAIGGYVFVMIRNAAMRRRILASKFAGEVFIDIDIYKQGLVTANGRSTVEMDWAAVKNILAGPRRLELESEATLVYIPERAFASRQAFNEAVATIRNFWREAQRAERDSAYIRAGLDEADMAHKP